MPGSRGGELFGLQPLELGHRHAALIKFVQFLLAAL